MDVIVDTAVSTIDVPPIPLVILPPGGTDSLLSLDRPGAITAGILSVSSNGSGGTDADSAASVVGADAVTGLVTAATITSVCSATPAGADGGAALIDADVAGTPLDSAPPPNTTVGVPGVGSVTLNEQESTANGIVIRGLHAVIDTPAVGADVIISESACFAGVAEVADELGLGGPAVPTAGTPNLAG